MSVGKRIKNRRKEMQMSQDDLASKIRITQATLSIYENGKGLPAADTIIQLATALDVSPNWLLGYDEDIVQRDDIAPDEKGVIQVLRDLSPENRARLVTMVNLFHESVG